MMKTIHDASADNRLQATMKPLVRLSAILLIVGLIGYQRSQPHQTSGNDEYRSQYQNDSRKRIRTG
jgi:predicted negative regulator of RcsB-dependent stress response